MIISRLIIALLTALLSIQCQPQQETPEFSVTEDRKSVEAILNILDDDSITTEDKMEVWVDDLVHMAPNHPLITDKPALIAHINNEKKYGIADMHHQITEMHSYAEIVVMHGKVTGTFYPANGAASNDFSTKNLFIFRRMQDNSLKIWKVIFNMTS